MWYTGIDWADEHHDALTIDEKGHQMGSIRVDYSPQGFAKLDEFLMQIIGSTSKEHMACIIETTHGLLIVHLLEAGWPVDPVNPRTVDRRRSASGAKTDLIDAYLLAKTGRSDFADLHRLIPDSEKVAELKQLTRDQDTLIRTQTRLVNQLTACLKAYYPVALDLFSKLQQKAPWSSCKRIQRLRLQEPQRFPSFNSSSNRQGILIQPLLPLRLSRCCSSLSCRPIGFLPAPNRA